MQTPTDREVQIVTLEPLQLAGLSLVVQTPPGGIPALWDRFIKRWGDLADRRIGEDAYGISRSLPGVPEAQGFEYLAALHVRSLDGLPAGTVGWSSEGGMHAMIMAHGIPDLGPAIRFFYRRWPPASQFSGRSNYCMELYPATYSQDERIHVYFPVQPRSAANTRT